MPHTDLHKKKLKKNLAVAGLIMLWCALIWAVTMIRIANADPFDPGRAAHLEKSLNTPEQWDENYANKAEARMEAEDRTEQKRVDRLNGTIAAHENWDNAYADKTESREERDTARDERRTNQLNKTETAPDGWWATWLENQQAREP